MKYNENYDIFINAIKTKYEMIISYKTKFDIQQKTITFLLSSSFLFQYMTDKIF